MDQMGQSCLCILGYYEGSVSSPFSGNVSLCMRTWMCEQGEKQLFLLGFVCPTFLHAQVTCVCAKILLEATCHSLLYGFICITCMYVHLFLI